MNENKQIVREFVDAINARDWDRLEHVVAAGFVRHSDAAGEPAVESLDRLKDFLRKEMEAFPDAFEEIEELIAEGDIVAARHRFSGTQRGPLGDLPPTDRRVEARYLAMYRLENRRIVESWAEWDNLTTLAQLGHRDAE